VCVLFLLVAHACVNLQRQAAAATTATVNGRQSRFDLLRKVKITLQIFTTYSCKRKFAATCTLPPTTKVESKSWNRIVHRPLCRIGSARVAFAALRAVMRASSHFCSIWAHHNQWQRVEWRRLALMPENSREWYDSWCAFGIALARIVKDFSNGHFWCRVVSGVQGEWIC
jgi:hypothetical protein